MLEIAAKQDRMRKNKRKKTHTAQRSHANKPIPFRCIHNGHNEWWFFLELCQPSCVAQISENMCSWNPSSSSAWIARWTNNQHNEANHFRNINKRRELLFLARITFFPSRFLRHTFILFHFFYTCILKRKHRSKSRSFRKWKITQQDS